METLDKETGLSRSKISSRIILAFFIIMFLITFFSKTINNIALPKVTYETPVPGALLKEVTGIGKVEAKKIRDLYVNNNMKVTEIMVEVGEQVKKGQILLALDISDIELQLQDERDRYAQKKIYLEQLIDASSPGSFLQLDKAIQVARQNLDKAQKNYDCSKILYELGGISLKIFFEAELDLDNARIDYEIAKKNREKTLNEIEREIENTKIDLKILKRKIVEMSKELDMGKVKAPCDGTVIELNYSEGMTATDSYPLYKIADSSGGFQFIGTINVNAAKYLEIGDLAEISISSLNGQIIKDKVKQIKDKQEQIGEAKDIEIDLFSDSLLVGQTGTMFIQKNIGFFELLLSNSAIGRDSNGYFVYVIKERNGPLGNEFYTERVSVNIGDSDNIKTAILSGLTPIDIVVSDSDKPISDGSRVLIAD